jgi:hypothetical protein
VEAEVSQSQTSKQYQMKNERVLILPSTSSSTDAGSDPAVWVITDHLKQSFAEEHDLEEFGDELVQMKHLFMSQESQDDVKNPGALLRRLSTLVDFRDTFPNVIVTLHIYLTLPSSNAGGERSFSCLKSR